MGKTAVLKMFSGLGAATLDADDIVGDLLNDEAVLERIRAEFGGGVFSDKGGLDRQKVASVIFRNKEKRDALEGILHPLVFERIEDFIGSLVENGADKIVVIEVPLLFEKGCSGRFQKIITVHTPRDAAFRRLEKAGINRDYAAMVLGAQMPIEEKIKMADFSIDNSGTLDETMSKVREVFNILLKGSKG